MTSHQSPESLPPRTPESAENRSALVDSVAAEWLAEQVNKGQEPWALFSDIDDSLIHRAGDPDAIAAAWKLREWSTKERVPLILITGTEFSAVDARIKAGEIPEPEIIVGAVGTDIWLRQKDGSWTQDQEYIDWLESTGYVRAKVLEDTRKFIDELTDSQPEYALQLQPGETGPHKISLHFMATDETAEALARQAEERFPDFKIVTCKEIHYNATLAPDAKTLKFCMDIVPATKADALAYLIGKLAIAGGFKAGDSGNDGDMLLALDALLPIVVGGSKSELLDLVKKYLVQNEVGPIFHLQDGREIYIETDELVKAAASIVKAINLALGHKNNGKGSI